MTASSIVITCEHAGNEVPADLKHLFAGQEEVLQTHRGWDPGSLDVGRRMAALLQAPLFYTLHSRLLIEANRSVHSTQLFSAFSKNLPEEEQQRLLHTYYYPYRNSVIEYLRTASLPVVHLSIHTFTPIWHGTPRQVDVGLLFDPDRAGELDLCNRMKAELEQKMPEYLIKHNEPYHGKDDGFVTFLRTQFSSTQYLGIELEINQKYVETPQLIFIADTIATVVQRIVA